MIKNSFFRGIRPYWLDGVGWQAGQTSEGSFSAASTPTFASKYDQIRFVVVAFFEISKIYTPSHLWSQVEKTMENHRSKLIISAFSINFDISHSAAKFAISHEVLRFLMRFWWKFVGISWNFKKMLKVLASEIMACISKKVAYGCIKP